MLKKYNIIINAFFIIFSLKYNLGYFLILPVIIFYLLKDFKSIYYIFPIISIASIIFMKEYFFITVVVMILIVMFYYLITYFLKSKNKVTIYIILFILLLNTITLLLTNNKDLLIIILSNIISILLYIYLEKNLYNVISENKVIINKKTKSLAYLEITLAIICILSSTQITIYNINLGLVVAVFYSMYFGKEYKDIYVYLYSLTTMILIYIITKSMDVFLILITSGIYILSSPFVSIIYNLILFIFILLNSSYSINFLISLMILSIIFELTNKFIIHETKNDESIFDEIYTMIQSNTNGEIMNFALFLDKFTVSFKNPSEYNERLSEGMKIFVQNHCNKCSMKKECFTKYNSKLYEIFKHLLLQEPNFIIKHPEFKDYCKEFPTLERSAKFLETKIKEPITHEKNKNSILIAQLNSVSNTIKKYVIDTTSKEELSYYKALALKTRLIEYGYIITYFDVVRLFKNDFLIKMGINEKKLEDIENTIKLIAENILSMKITVIKEQTERNTIYINIIPQIKIDITYGYGALSCLGEDICGDNYLIKEVNNGRFISAISDGMGKGYRAFCESNMTLKLVDEIVKLNLTKNTALEILNSLYLVQDYLEEYATLDFVEINRINQTASFYKMGAATSYIFRSDGTIEKILNKSLPFGLDEDVDSVVYNIYPGDLILMSSDGIFENIIDETKLQTYIESIKNFPPQKIVYELLNYTINNKIKTKDDMSIIALKIDNTN